MTPTPSHIEQIFRDVWQKHRASIITQAVGKISETWDEKELPQLVQLLNRHFNEEELKTFTFELGEQYDNLPAQGKEAKIRELVTKFFRHRRMTELAEHAMKTRPKVLWNIAPPTTPEPVPVDWVEVAQWDRVNWGEAAQSYIEFIKNTYGTMRVLGQPAPIPLEGIFTDVYILDKQLATQRFSIEEMQKLYARHEPFEQGSTRQPGVEAVRKIQKLFILGKPGAGKTTFLKYLALQAADGKLPLLPLFVPLKQWADSGIPLLQFLVQQLGVCHFPPATKFVEKLLQEGKTLLLLDGLDEVGETHRVRVTEEIRQTAQTYWRNQFVMTCRIAANEYTFTQFTEGEIADFAPPQVERFAEKWFADDPEKGKLFLAELEKPDHGGLRELARIPLLLTLLCLGFTETLVFPNRRAEIYEEAIDALLKRWDASRNIRRDEPYKNLTLGRKRQLLARIAATSFEKEIYFFSKRQLVSQIETYLRGAPRSNPDKIDGEAVLRAMEAQHGILIERAHGIYSFAHLTFQEYFTSRHIVENVADGALRRLRQFLTERRWREVFLLTASSLDDASRLFTGMLKDLEGMAASNTAIRRLLVWADQKTKGGDLLNSRLQANGNLTNRRVLYVFLALVLALDLDLNVNLAVALAFNRGLNIARALALILDRIRVLTHDFLIVFAPAYAHAFDPAHAVVHAHTLISTLDFNVDRDIALDFVLGYVLLVVKVHYVGELFQKAIEWSEEYPLPALNQTLKKLKIPGKKASDKVRQQFCTDLRYILQTHRQLGHEWQVTYEDVKILEDYLVGCELLGQCLKLAYVADREGILARLLQPPEMGK